MIKIVIAIKKLVPKAKPFNPSIIFIPLVNVEIAKIVKKTDTNLIDSNLSIINISSIAGKRGSANNSAYCASKFAVNGVTQSLAKELGEKNIRVNAICPVLIKTEGLVKALNHKFSPAKKNINKFFKGFSNQNSATGNLPTAEDVASMCYYLSKKESSSITGQCKNIDCGVFPQ